MLNAFVLGGLSFLSSVRAGPFVSKRETGTTYFLILGLVDNNLHFSSAYTRLIFFLSRTSKREHYSRIRSWSKFSSQKGREVRYVFITKKRECESASRRSRPEL